jgi:hypothetical protein
MYNEMNKTIYRKSAIVILAIFLSSCVQSARFVNSDPNSLGPIKVVMYKTPKINVATLGGLFLQSLGGLLTAPVGIVINENAAQKVKGGVKLLDFGGLVMMHFSERVGQEISNWPQMIIIDQPVNKGYKSADGNQLEFAVDKWGVAGRYFYSLTIVTMKSSDGQILWKKAFSYHSSTYGRGMALEEFLADNGKLLKEEVAFAADLTVTDFINHLKGEG